MSSEDPLSIKGLTHKALKVLIHCSDPDNEDTAIPDNVIRDCAGLAFVSTVKAGFLITVSGGAGIVIARGKNGEWTGPIKVATIGVGGGAKAGIGKTDAILVLNDSNAVKAFRGGQVKLGADIGLAVGPLGRSASMSAAMGKKFTGVFSYATTTGLYGGLGLDGTLMTVRKGALKTYYGKGVTAKQVLEGDVAAPKWVDLANIHKILNAMSKRAGRAKAPSGPQYRPSSDKKKQEPKKKMPRMTCPNCKKGIRPPEGASKFRCPWCKAILQYKGKEGKVGKEGKGPKKTGPKPAAEAAGPWTCGSCTYINKAAAAACLMCQAPKSTADAPQSRQAQAHLGQREPSAPTPSEPAPPAQPQKKAPPAYQRSDTFNLLSDAFGAEAEQKAADESKAVEEAKQAQEHQMQALPPAWLRGEIEAPGGEKDMGGWKQGVYTSEQQARLGVDENGQKVEADPFAGLSVEPAVTVTDVDPFADLNTAINNSNANANANASDTGRESTKNDAFADLLVMMDETGMGAKTQSPGHQAPADGWGVDALIADATPDTSRNSLSKSSNHSQTSSKEVDSSYEQGAAEYKEILRAISDAKKNKKK